MKTLESHVIYRAINDTWIITIGPFKTQAEGHEFLHVLMDAMRDEWAGEEDGES